MPLGTGPADYPALMTVSELSASTQTYLKVVWGLEELSDDAVTASRIAARTSLKVSTVSEAVRKLTEQGLLEHAPYGSVTLTAEGRAHAVAMVRRHRLIESFLVQVLGYGWDEVHDEADVLEHAVSDLMVERIDRFLDHPERDPHGHPIPTPDGSVGSPTGISLGAANPGQMVTVERVSDADPALLQYFAAQGVVVGARLEIVAGEPFSGATRVRVGEGSSLLTLSSAALEAVFVSYSLRED